MSYGYNLIHCVVTKDAQGNKDMHFIQEDTVRYAIDQLHDKYKTTPYTVEYCGKQNDYH